MMSQSMKMISLKLLIWCKKSGKSNGKNPPGTLRYGTLLPFPTALFWTVLSMGSLHQKKPKLFLPVTFTVVTTTLRLFYGRLILLKK